MPDHVSKAAVEAVARRIAANDGHGHWALIENKAPYENAARALLEAALPIHDAELKERLLDDKFIEAVLAELERGGWTLEGPNSDEGSADQARPAFAAALDEATSLSLPQEDWTECEQCPELKGASPALQGPCVDGGPHTFTGERLPQEEAGQP